MDDQLSNRDMSIIFVMYLHLAGFCGYYDETSGCIMRGNLFSNLITVDSNQIL